MLKLVTGCWLLSFLGRAEFELVELLSVRAYLEKRRFLVEACVVEDLKTQVKKGLS